MPIDIVWLEDMLLNRKVSPAEAAALTEKMQVVKVANGEKIVNQGQPGGVLYIVRSGSVVVQHDGPKPVTMASVGEGAALGELSFLTDDSASASVVAQSDCVIYRITRAEFSTLMMQHHELVYSLFAYLLRHTATVIRHMNDNHISMMQYISGGRMGI